jgi:cell division protein FtsW (lipid II flippase)
MNIDFSSIPYNQIVWWVLAIVGVVVVFVVVRFFWKHILKYLFHGCLVILAVIALLAVLRYFKVF